LCRISGGRLGAEMPFKIGEARRRQAGERSDSVCGEQMPVPRLPCRTQPLISRETQLQQWDERGCKHEESHNLAISRNPCVSLQEQVADGKWSGNNFAEEHDPTAAIEHRIHRVVGVAVRAMTERGRRINRIKGGARAERSAGDNG
jgi:hypothetical protein